MVDASLFTAPPECKAGKRLKKESVDVFFEEGFSEKFYTHLRRYVWHLYKNRFNVNESWDQFYDNVRGKIEYLLGAEDIACIFDSNKGTLVSLIFKVVYNECTKANSKNERKVYIDDPQHELLAANLCSPHTNEMQEPRDRFLSLAAERGIEIDQEMFNADLAEARLTPYVFTYLWIYNKGGRHGICL